LYVFIHKAVVQNYRYMPQQAVVRKHPYQHAAIPV